MHTTDALEVTSDVRTAVSIDLIGDLDGTLGTTFSDALSTLVDQGTTDVVVMTRHVSLTSEEGLTALDVALGAARAKGCSVLVDLGSRRMKAAFAAAHIAIPTPVADARRRSSRHLMIARHAEKPTLLRSA